MNNKFDPENAAIVEPRHIVVGGRVAWRKPGLATVYPANLYSVKYVSKISSVGGAEEFSVVGEVDGDDWLFTITSANSASFTPHNYHWQLEVTRTSDDERVDIETGNWVVVTDLDNNLDPRSHDELMVDKIKALLEGRASSVDASYSINGRSLTKLSPEELMKFLSFYEARVVEERRKEAARNGRPHSGKIKGRFR